MSDGKKFTESLVEATLKTQMIKNFAGMLRARQQGKSHERSVDEILRRDAQKSFCGIEINELPAGMQITLDKAVSYGESWCIWRYEDGKIIVEEMGSGTPPEAPEPPKKPAKPVDFFPSKIDRIAKMPRYPGVWG